MRAVVDPDTCIGCELCVQTCPDLFRMESDKAVAYKNPVPASAEESCREATDNCPVNAITVE